jgi:hypothetical protein
LIQKKEGSMRVIRLLFVVTLAAHMASADIVELKDGRRMSGRVLLFDGQQLRLATGDRIDTFAVADLSLIRFGEEVAGSSQTSFRPSPAIPAGTVMEVRTIDSIDSQKASPGQTFRASLDEPVVVGGTTVAPKGADVVLKVTAAKDAGKLRGNAQLTVSLASVKIGDRMVDVNTENLTSSSSGKGKGTATKAGVGAAGGALLGGLLGGGKGALIGAVAGGGAGTGVAMMTKGPRVNIPSETHLSFTVQ